MYDNNKIETPLLGKVEEISTHQRLPSLSDVLHCQFSQWYPIFSNLPRRQVPSSSSTKKKSSNSEQQTNIIGNRQRRPYRTNVTIPSVILSPPESFRLYLQADGIFLPNGAQTTSGFLDHHHGSSAANNTPDDDDDDQWWSDGTTPQDDPSSDNDHKSGETANGDDNNDDMFLSAAFDQLNHEIEEAISRLGGAGVIPKLNWSAPKDATWINGGTMQCKTVGDVYLLLKASDFCSYDVNYACTDTETQSEEINYKSRITTESSTAPDNSGINGTDMPLTQTADPRHVEASTNTKQPPLCLVLRKWCKLYPSQEFRCFISHCSLLAISQRHITQQWPHLMNDADHYKKLMMDFCSSIVIPHIPTDLIQYVVDLYIDQQDRVWLLDVNVWASRTDSLLFDWSELDTMVMTLIPSTLLYPDNNNEDEDYSNSNDELVELRLVESGRQIQTDPLASYRAPIDTVHLASMNGGDATKFQEFMDLCRSDMTREEDDD